MYDILILILALVLFTVLAFLRVGAMPLAGIVALVTCVLARLPILDTMLGPGIISVIVEAILIIIWFEFRTKQLERQGRFFDDPTLPPLPESEKNFSDDPDEKMPNAWVALAPIAIILILFNGVHLKVEAAVFFGIVAACILFWPFIKAPRKYISMFNDGGSNAVMSLMNTAIVVGFGGVAQQTAGFTKIVNGVLSLHMSPLVFVAIAVAVCAGMCGSASGGMGIAFNALKDTFISLGVNLEYVHRISAIAAGTLDTLPHQGGQITILTLTHMNHKTAYWDICVTQLIIPLLTVFAVTSPLCSLGL